MVAAGGGEGAGGPIPDAASPHGPPPAAGGEEGAGARASAGRTRLSGGRRVALGFWLAVAIGLSALYAARPELIDPANLVSLLRRSGSFVLLGYAALSVARPVTLVPSTVLVVVGTLLFPDRPATVFCVSLAGVAASAGIIYYFFDFLGLARVFERSHAARIRWMEDQMRRRGLAIVVGWSVFPFVPTDAICYVAGTLRMPIGRFLLGVTLGKVPLVAFYVAGGTWVFGS